MNRIEQLEYEIVKRNEIKMPPLSKKAKPDIDYLGNKLADLSERVNEVELSISDLTNIINRVMGRRGL